MVGVDIRSLLEKCNDFCTAALHGAAGQAVNRSHYEVAVEHFLLACLENSQADVPLALARAGIDADKLRAALNRTLESFRSGNSGRPVFSPLLLDLLEAAWLVSSVDLGLGRIRSGAVLAAFLGKPGVFSQGNYTENLSSLGRDDLLKNFARLAEESCETAAAMATSEDGVAKAASAGSGESFIAKFCEDFTAKARAGKIDPVFGRDSEIRQMVDILARRRKNNPILVGEPGVGKTAVLEGLALRIVENDVPEVLQNVSLISLDLGLLEAGAGMKGEFERRLKGVLDEIKASATPIVLFIDEAHMLVGAGGAAGGSDAANLMKPALARGEIRTCAATTWKEYKKYFEKDPALARRFQLVSLDEPSVESATLILRGIRASYEKAHKVIVRDEACEAAATLAKRYISGRFLPDKAIDLLDTACARVKVSQSAKPAGLEDAERAAQALGREIDSRERDLANGNHGGEEIIASLKEEQAAKNSLADQLRGQWQDELAAVQELLAAREAVQAVRLGDQAQSPAGTEGDESTAAPLSAGDADAKLEEASARLASLREGRESLVHIEVTAEVVAQVVSDWTGIPVGKMAKEQAGTIADLPQLLGKQIQGQDPALATISKTLQASAAGLRAPNQPMGIFLLVGPSGVGKTQTGLALADLLFGDEGSVVTVNMSEFQEKHTVSRLIGSPPGYVGYGEGGMLTEAVRRKPYSVVLLDEVEKAHIDVLNLFYQVFDKGILTDGEGKEINFANTIILLTSNLATDVLSEFGSTESLAENGLDMDAVNAAIHPILAEHFRPALLARMTVVPYLGLGPAAMGNITRLKLDSLAKRLLQGNRMRLDYSQEVVEQIVARCSESDTGARNIDYIMAGNVLPQLSQNILQRMGQGAMPEAVRIDVDQDGQFAISFDGEPGETGADLEKQSGIRLDKEGRADMENPE